MTGWCTRATVKTRQMLAANWRIFAPGRPNGGPRADFYNLKKSAHSADRSGVKFDPKLAKGSRKIAVGSGTRVTDSDSICAGPVIFSFSWVTWKIFMVFVSYELFMVFVSDEVCMVLSWSVAVGDGW